MLGRLAAESSRCWKKIIYLLIITFNNVTAIVITVINKYIDLMLFQELMEGGKVVDFIPVIWKIAKPKVE